MIPNHLQFTKTHEWVEIEGDLAVCGITDFAQEQLGDLTFIELPELGDIVEEGQEMGTVESVKAACDLYAPVSGEVVEVNDELNDAPEKVNEDPFGDGWMIKIRLREKPKELLSPEEYEELLAAEGH